METDYDKAQLEKAITDAANDIRMSLYIAISCVGMYIICIVVALVELIRLGPFTNVTIAWYLIALVIFILSRINSPDRAKLTRYTDLVHKYKEKYQ